MTRRGKALLFHHRGIKLQTMFHSKAPKTWGTVIIKSASKKSAVKVGRLLCQKNEEKNSKKVGTLSAILKLKKKSYIAKAFGFYFLRVADRSLAFFQKYGARSNFFYGPISRVFFLEPTISVKKLTVDLKTRKNWIPFSHYNGLWSPPVYSCNCACNFVNFVIIWTIWYISSCNFVNFVTIDKITGGVGSISSVNIHLNGQNWLCKLNFVNSGRSNSPKYSPPCQFCQLYQLCQFCHRIGKIHKIDIFICSFVNFVNSGLIWLPQILPPVTVSFVSILWDLTPANTPPLTILSNVW